MKEKRKENPALEFALNGLSIHSLSVNQAGDLEVEFDLPQEQTTDQWHTYRRASRTFDVYEDEELQAACRRLFELVRRRVMRPDPARQAVHCDRCKTSACCRKYNVLVTRKDIETLAARFNMAAKSFQRRYTSPAVDWCGDYEFQLAADEDDDGEEKCVFLQRDEHGRWRCSVYEHRPEICRAFDMRSCDDFVPIDDVGVLKD